MKTLYIDARNGAAGDMLAASLFNLIENKEEILNTLNHLLPGVSVSLEEIKRNGIKGNYFKVSFKKQHSHNHLKSINEKISSFPISQKAKENICAIYQILAEAESTVHGEPVEKIHFHEVGDLDAIIDITAVTLLLEKLKVNKIISSSITTGTGYVKCAHGILPVPAPATLQILKGLPITFGEVKTERTTPTGAALLKFYVNEFSDNYPMIIEKIGYGFGKKELEDGNYLTTLLIREDQKSELFLLETNIDDLSGEEIGFAQEMCFKYGALDVYFTPIQMKKNRPGIIFSVLTKEENKEDLIKIIFKYTSTLGIRESIYNRYELSRKIKTEETILGEIKVKEAQGFGISKKKYEFEDLKEIAGKNNLTIKEVKEKL